jgi:hypothetical protein
MSERVLTNAYWMEEGARIERERILDLVSSQVCDCTPDCGRLDTTVEKMINLIKGESKVKEINELLGIIGK